HNVVATVFLECHAMYRAGGPAEMRPVGETEFVAGIAAMSESGQYGPARVAAGIVGFADLTLGDRVSPVLEALIRAGGGRFRGVRHSAAWDASEVIGNSAVANGPHLMKQADFRAGLARLTALGLSLDAWVFHPQLGVHRVLHRARRADPLHVREQLPRREDGHRVRRALERVQAPRRARVGRGEAGALQHHRETSVSTSLIRARRTSERTSWSQ